MAALPVFLKSLLLTAAVFVFDMVIFAYNFADSFRPPPPGPTREQAPPVFDIDAVNIT